MAKRRADAAEQAAAGGARRPLAGAAAVAAGRVVKKPGSSKKRQESEWTPRSAATANAGSSREATALPQRANPRRSGRPRHMLTNETRVSLCWHEGLCSTVVEMSNCLISILAHGCRKMRALKIVLRFLIGFNALPFVSGECRAYTSQMHHACCSTSGGKIQVAHPCCLSDCTRYCLHEFPPPELQPRLNAQYVCQTRIMHCAFHTLLHGGVDLHVTSSHRRCL